MKIIINIDCSNEAFGDYAEEEIARVLIELGQRISYTGFNNRPIFDLNGNKVGELVINHDD